jgi:beta-N-acetylhexosaminidase
VVDVDTNPNNPVIGDRAFGEDPDLVGRLGAALIEGLQESGVAACAKHFPGHGDTELDSHLDLPVVVHPRSRLEDVEMRPFRAAVAAGAASIMTAHVLYPELDERLPATLSPKIVGLLREGLKYEGVIVSDDLEMNAMGCYQRAILAAPDRCGLISVSKTPRPVERSRALVRDRGAPPREGPLDPDDPLAG